MLGVRSNWGSGLLRLTSGCSFGMLWAMSTKRILIDLGSGFTDVTGEIVQRLRIMKPSLVIEQIEGVISIEGRLEPSEKSELKRLTAQIAYQQRIFRDTLRIRERIYRG